MTNKAIIVAKGGGYDRVSLGEHHAAEPEAGQITVRLRASSLNPHDRAIVSGSWALAEPRIPMADGAGVVTAIGEGVSDFKIGDNVVSTFFPGWQSGESPVDGFGSVPGDGIDGYARQTVTCSAQAFTLAPAGWSHVEAATLTTAALTSWRALMCNDRVKAGDTVLVQGTGGVSLFALQFAKTAGATVIGTSSSDAKLERLRAAGADHVINYRRHPNWGEVARRLTGGRGVDHVIEVGGPATFDQSMIAARIGGHIALIGVLTGFAGEINLVTAVLKQLRVLGVLVGSRTQQQDMVRAIDSNGMKPIIDSVFPLDDIVQAFKYHESGQHFGKICLEM
jgi:NADPH:quinone reductase-like Zn-dependent oxidoreductase